MPICGWLHCSEIIQVKKGVFNDRCVIFKILKATEFYTIILSKVQSKPSYKKDRSSVNFITKFPLSSSNARRFKGVSSRIYIVAT